MDIFAGYSQIQQIKQTRQMISRIRNKPAIDYPTNLNPTDFSQSWQTIIKPD